MTGATPSASSAPSTAGTLTPGPTAPSRSSSRRPPDDPRRPGSRSSPTPWPPSPGTTWMTRNPAAGPSGTSRPPTRPTSTARTTPTWPAASGGHDDLVARAGRMVPFRSARPTRSTRPTRSRRLPSAGRRATPPTPWAPSIWPTTRLSSSEGRSPDCVFWNMCLWNPFLHTYNYDYEQVTINGAQVTYEPDGSWVIVVRPSDRTTRTWSRQPDTARAASGSAGSCPNETPDQPEVTVVPAAAG